MNNSQSLPIHVTIAHSEGCENTQPTRAVVALCAAELSLPIQLEMVRVTTEEDARWFRLHGSPTVLVDGLDVDPTMRERTDLGFT